MGVWRHFGDCMGFIPPCLALWTPLALHIPGEQPFFKLIFALKFSSPWRRELRVWRLTNISLWKLLFAMLFLFVLIMNIIWRTNSIGFVEISWWLSFSFPFSHVYEEEEDEGEEKKWVVDEMEAIIVLDSFLSRQTDETPIRAVGVVKFVDTTMNDMSRPFRLTPPLSPLSQ